MEDGESHNTVHNCYNRLRLRYSRWVLPINAERNDRARNRLLEALRRGNSLALVGAGVSIWAGYGSWGQVI